MRSGLTSRRRSRRSPRHEPAPRSTPADSAPKVADNLRRLRLARGLSLERLARASGVSRAMLGQIELEQSTPTIGLLWKIARALGVPFSALIAAPSGPPIQVLRATQAKILRSADARFSSRALFPFDEDRDVEFYELRLSARAVERAEAHAPGTTENLVVARGSIEIVVGGERHRLAAGDAIQFGAETAHEYRNRSGSEAVMYLVMTYAGRRR